MNIFLDTLPGILFLSFIGIGAVWGKIHEKRQWNNGISQKSGEPWVLFDNDSQGGRGYTDNNGNFIWITYSVDE